MKPLIGTLIAASVVLGLAGCATSPRMSAEETRGQLALAIGQGDREACNVVDYKAFRYPDMSWGGEPDKPVMQNQPKEIPSPQVGNSGGGTGYMVDCDGGKTYEVSLNGDPAQFPARVTEVTRRP